MEIRDSLHYAVKWFFVFSENKSSCTFEKWTKKCMSKSRKVRIVFILCFSDNYINWKEGLHPWISIQSVAIKNTLFILYYFYNFLFNIVYPILQQIIWSGGLFYWAQSFIMLLLFSSLLIFLSLCKCSGGDFLAGAIATLGKLIMHINYLLKTIGLWWIPLLLNILFNFSQIIPVLRTFYCTFCIIISRYYDIMYKIAFWDRLLS
jgi:hypothetical protein